MGKKIDGAGDSFGAGFGDVAPVASVMLRGMADIPALNAVWCPRSAHLRSLMDEYLCAWRGHWCFIEVEGTIHMGFG